MGDFRTPRNPSPWQQQQPMAKAQGFHAARILKEKHRDHKYRSSKYKGRLTKHLRAVNTCMASGIVLKKVGVGAKQPNSAIRKCVVVQLMTNGNFFTSHQGLSGLF